MRLELDALKRFVADLAAAPDQWLPHVRHDRGARDYQQIWEDQDVNAWVICWSLDHDTGFHDHDQSAAGIAVVAGQVREERLRIGSSPQSRLLGRGSTFIVPASAIHRVRHAGEVPSVTIHAYSPPLERTGVPGGPPRPSCRGNPNRSRRSSAPGRSCWGDGIGAVRAP
jgi:mannose-6-phosphate isomerase-like protein (cupin superfamily)